MAPPRAPPPTFMLARALPRAPPLTAPPAPWLARTAPRAHVEPRKRVVIAQAAMVAKRPWLFRDKP